MTNQKGGVAKTTTVASLGAALAELGQRVVLVDLDPQACLTFSLGVDPEELETSVNDALLGKADLVDTVVELDDGLDLVPATIELAGAEAALLTRTGRELALRHLLEGLQEDAERPYDWVLLDCPPSLGVLTVNALTAAREVMVPLQCETLSHRGVGQLLDTVHDVRRLLNPRLSLLGVLPTLFDARTNHARAVLADVSDRYGLPVLQPAIPKSVRFAEAPAAGRTVLETARSSRGAEAYRELARGLLDGTASRAVEGP
ncbi:MAG TPA: ParA family protein [Jiangellales bacterium]|nr:ParA family protein [Jiangellales bacterium]